jgi:hypothetical protein
MDYLTAAYTAVLIWWHLTATAHTMRDTLPDGHLLARWFTTRARQSRRVCAWGLSVLWSRVDLTGRARLR